MNHTVTLAIASNAIVVNDYGRRERNFIFPMLILRLWVPGLLVEAVGRAGVWLRTWWAVLFGPGWKDDLRLIGLAARLLIFGGAAGVI